MRYRLLDANGDYTFGRSANSFTANTPLAVAQAVQTRLQLWLGEWFVDTTDGTPESTEVLGKYTKTAYDAAIQARILGTQGVTQITAYNSTFDGQTRKLTITTTISTVYGSTPLVVSI